MHHVGTLFGRRRASPDATGVASAIIAPRSSAPIDTATPGPSAAGAVPTSEADWRLSFFEWMIDAAVVPADVLHPLESRCLAHLDTVLACDEARATLLPRAPAVIPQLLNSLRQEGASASDWAQHVMRDPHLVAEVIRSANSAHARAGEPVVDIAQAIDRIGVDGLRRAIARVVLKPMFGGTGDSLSARCAPRLWQHSEAEAAACQQEAVARGLDPFEGYLAGLMHGIGWTAALRAIDRARLAPPMPLSRAFVTAFERRRESFFALLVMAWQLSDGLSALGSALRLDA
ncbi:MAG TPA: HDOD domain-containing protein, partial [Burkholderiaceae bacterium]|nr:HDOD domain-containing protein [Burkholderiaceae bacterium]